MASDMNLKTAAENTILRFALQGAIGLLVSIVIGLEGWILVTLQDHGKLLAAHGQDLANITISLSNEHAATTKQLDYVNSIILNKGAERDQQLMQIQIAATQSADKVESLTQKFEDLRAAVQAKWTDNDEKMQAIWTAISRIQSAVLPGKGR
jgi:hypothetical protein